MKLTTSRFSIHCMALVLLAAWKLPMLVGEAHCPGNIPSVTPRMVAGAFIVIPVKVNQQGPFDFIVDTGNQVSVIDPALAAQLSPRIQGSGVFVTKDTYANASIFVLDSVEAASQAVEHTLATVRDLDPINAFDPHIRGILGEDFLARFDMLIDYRHSLLCLDASGQMRDQVRGERISLIHSQHPDDALPFARRLLLTAHLSGAGSRKILLQLDSGSDGPILYQSRGESRLALLDQSTPRSGNLSEVQRAFAELPPQDLRIGTRTVRHVAFVTPVNRQPDALTKEEDGLLPTVLFQRIFICAGGSCVVFDPH